MRTRWSVTTGKLERWTFSETGGLNASTFVEPKVIKWQTFDGREILGIPVTCRMQRNLRASGR